MQNRAVRLCRNLRKYDHVSEHYKHLRWLQLEALIQYRSLCLMHHQFHQLQCITLYNHQFHLVDIIIIVLELVLSLQICLDVVLLFHKGTSVTRHHNGGMDCWVMKASPPPLQTVVHFHFHVIYLIIFVNCNNIFCVYV